jgi:2,3-diketo-5-methylthio-1-phosphopentane phosphatase
MPDRPLADAPPGGAPLPGAVPPGTPPPGSPAAGAAPPVPPLVPGQPPLAILVDYDGTIALTDVSDTITGALLPPEVERELEEAYETGRVGSREIMAREMDLLPPDPRVIDDIVAAQPHDPTFASFVRRARAAGIPVDIVSDGFGFFIGPAMERLGVAADVTIVTARTTFDGGRPRIDFPNGHPTCHVCGTCKRNRVLAHQAAGRAVLFIGDGESDRYAAGYSDFVFAKRSLVAICQGLGWPYARWDQFAEIERWLRNALAAAAPGEPIVARRPHPFFCGPEVWGSFRTAPPEPFTVVGGETAPLGLPQDTGSGRSEPDRAT